MKTILCYGDSNTWGYRASPEGGRYPFSVRWTGRLQQLLGSGYQVFEDGMNSRTTVFDDPTADDRNGKALLLPALERTRPLDMLILMLGTNDLKLRFGVPVSDIGLGMGLLVKTARTYISETDGRALKILIIAPPHIRESLQNAPFLDSYGMGAVARSHALAPVCRHVAETLHCGFLDAASIVQAGDEDGVHLNHAGHAALAAAICACIHKTPV